MLSNTLDKKKSSHQLDPSAIRDYLESSLITHECKQVMNFSGFDAAEESDAQQMTFQDLVILSDFKLDPHSTEHHEHAVEKIKTSVSALLTYAGDYHRQHNFEPPQFINFKTGKENHITHVVSSEFSYYTQRPMQLKTFEQVLNGIADTAKQLPQNLNVCLASFAVHANPLQVMNVTVIFDCGESFQMALHLKNNVHKIDPVFTAKFNGKEIKLKNISADDHKLVKSLRVTVNGKSLPFRFDNSVIKKTAGGLPYFYNCEICYDHFLGTAAKKLNHALLKKIVSFDREGQHTLLPTRSLHVVTSQTVSISMPYLLGNLTHADNRHFAHTALQAPLSDMPQAIFFLPAAHLARTKTLVVKHLPHQLHLLAEIYNALYTGKLTSIDESGLSIDKNYQAQVCFYFLQSENIVYLNEAWEMLTRNPTILKHFLMQDDVPYFKKLLCKIFEMNPSNIHACTHYEKTFIDLVFNEILHHNNLDVQAHGLTLLVHNPNILKDLIAYCRTYQPFINHLATVTGVLRQYPKFHAGINALYDLFFKHVFDMLQVENSTECHQALKFLFTHNQFLQFFYGQDRFLALHKRLKKRMSTLNTEEGYYYTKLYKQIGKFYISNELNSEADDCQIEVVCNLMSAYPGLTRTVMTECLSMGSVQQLNCLIARLKSSLLPDSFKATFVKYLNQQAEKIKAHLFSDVKYENIGLSTSLTFFIFMNEILLKQWQGVEASTSRNALVPGYSRELEKDESARLEEQVVKTYPQVKQKPLTPP